MSTVNTMLSMVLLKLKYLAVYEKCNTAKCPFQNPSVVSHRTPHDTRMFVSELLAFECRSELAGQAALGLVSTYTLTHADTLTNTSQIIVCV